MLPESKFPVTGNFFSLESLCFICECLLGGEISNDRSKLELGQFLQRWRDERGGKGFYRVPCFLHDVIALTYSNGITADLPTVFNLLASLPIREQTHARPPRITCPLVALIACTRLMHLQVEIDAKLHYVYVSDIITVKR